jgi:hypothetical protein
MVGCDRGALPNRPALSGPYPRRDPAGLRTDEQRLAEVLTLRTRNGPLPDPGRGPLSCGAPLRNRTVDLLLTMETLCRLS